MRFLFSRVKGRFGKVLYFAGISHFPQLVLQRNAFSAAETTLGTEKLSAFPVSPDPPERASGWLSCPLRLLAVKAQMRVRGNEQGNGKGQEEKERNGEGNRSKGKEEGEKRRKDLVRVKGMQKCQPTGK